MLQCSKCLESYFTQVKHGLRKGKEIPINVLVLKKRESEGVSMKKAW